MFRKFITLGWLVSILSVASSISIFAQTNLTDENQTVSNNIETKNKKLCKVFLKKEDKSQVNFNEKNNLAAYQKQKAQGKNFSTGTKILIGIGMAAAVVGVVVFAASRDKIRTF